MLQGQEVCIMLSILKITSEHSFSCIFPICGFICFLLSLFVSMVFFCLGGFCSGNSCRQLIQRKFTRLSWFAAVSTKVKLLKRVFFHGYIQMYLKYPCFVSFAIPSLFPVLCREQYVYVSIYIYTLHYTCSL